MRKETLFLIAGHYQMLQGATAFNGKTEHWYTTRLQQKIAALLEGRMKVVIDNKKDNLTTVIKKINEQAKPGDLVLDIHFNNNFPGATGVEVFVHESTSVENRLRATALVEGISLKTGFKIRQYLSVRKYKLPKEANVGLLAILTYTRVPAILLEVCFLNEIDLPIYEGKIDEVAATIADIYAPRYIGDLDSKPARTV